MMAHRTAPLNVTPRPLQEALQFTLALPATSPGQQTAQREIISALEAALDARRQQIIVSRAEVNAVKWSCLYLQPICALLAIAFVHCDDRLASLLAIGLFATGVSASVLLIAAHDRPFVGQIAVTPEPLMQIISDDPVTSAERKVSFFAAPTPSALSLPVARASNRASSSTRKLRSGPVGASDVRFLGQDRTLAALQITSTNDPM
jgi:hypothetical protein